MLYRRYPSYLFFPFAFPPVYTNACQLIQYVSACFLSSFSIATLLWTVCAGFYGELLYFCVSILSRYNWLCLGRGVGEVRQNPQIESYHTATRLIWSWHGSVVVLLRLRGNGTNNIGGIRIQFAVWNKMSCLHLYIASFRWNFKS